MSSTFDALFTSSPKELTASQDFALSYSRFFKANYRSLPIYKQNPCYRSFHKPFHHIESDNPNIHLSSVIMSVVTRAKRKRTGSSSGTGPAVNLAVLQQHPTLWYEDGNVVISAGKTMFLVHRSLLSRQSDVLAGLMLSAVQSHGSSPVEGCPLVTLDNSADDIAVVLTAIYDSRPFIQGIQLTFSTVSAMFRLGSEYKIQWLRDEALSRLQACYPDTLAKYDELVDRFDPKRPMPWTHTQDYEVALLAQSYFLNSILVTALYECCTGKPWELLLRLGLNEEGRQTPSTSVPFNRELIQKLFRGRSELVTLRTTQTFGFIDEKILTKGCTKKSLQMCLLVIHDMATNAHKLGLLMDNACALDQEEDFIDEAGKGGCQSCIALWKKRHRAGRQRVWDSLYMVFRVPEELDL
ncbi:hypothetical protein EVG20_g2908 [Dentipellis fragilis]|uniref:BTB domain-containing protein n=1 Tax=Dentipellis fragilis TaxID=205917 RepID=A0A4Y9Z9E6_9AGAM|nr:hypothetical protein EVG20_g2908 [Dentipellis fragilis]